MWDYSNIETVQLRYLCPFFVYKTNILQHCAQNKEERCHKVNIDGFHIRNSWHGRIYSPPDGSDCQQSCDTQSHPGRGCFAIDEQWHPGNEHNCYARNVDLYQVKTYSSFERERGLQNRVLACRKNICLQLNRFCITCTSVHLIESVKSFGHRTKFP